MKLDVNRLLCFNGPLGLLELLAFALFQLVGLQFDWRKSSGCSVRERELAAVLTLLLSPAPSLEEWNGHVLLLLSEFGI